MAAFDGKYYNAVQPYQRHTAVPTDGIYVYSFALKPEEHQPTGSANFSRIDSAYLSVQLLNVNKILADLQQAITAENRATLEGGITLNIWAVNVNVLRIMSGMGGVAFSN